MGALLAYLRLFAVHILMSYNGGVLPWCALLGSVLIMVLAHWSWPAGWRGRLGLRIPAGDAILAIAIAPILMLLLYATIQYIAAAQSISYQLAAAQPGLLSPIYLHTLGQTLNEEMLFGALLLNAIGQKFPRSRPLGVAVLVAAGFSALHYVFYRWIVLRQYGGALSVGALFVLFAIGLLRNTLILKAGHIAYSWSLHFSINAVGLVALYNFENGAKLGEPQVFNFILGAPAAVFGSVFVLAACSAALWRARPAMAADS